jgi:hypothetical protein
VVQSDQRGKAKGTLIKIVLELLRKSELKVFQKIGRLIMVGQLKRWVLLQAMVWLWHHQGRIHPNTMIALLRT